ncbi:Lrp/AsnC family transcriptional regulator [Aliikangiella sp. IMCC44359]|uniref:Lrp/AsnC family transcriptional regulator n=1 Tax=Aliikangiella sp. IMCC44359 TaxID=3459125 RepID=UPI00403AA42F
MKVKNNILQHKVKLTPLEKLLINRLQNDLPLVPEPFLMIANELGCDESEVITSLQNLLDKGVITRFGPLFDISKKQGAFSLCALKVAQSKVDDVAKLVNSYPQVAHNYLREHEWNMWFVLATSSPQELEDAYQDIVTKSNCVGINCPKEREFFVGLYLPV